MAAIALRDDLDAATLRLLARRTGAAGQGRRLLALAEIYDGGSRGKAARSRNSRCRSSSSQVDRRAPANKSCRGFTCTTGSPW